MRCLACGGEMVLISAFEDLTKPALGFGRETYIAMRYGRNVRGSSPSTSVTLLESGHHS
jgi:hypothetical protein